MCTCASSTPEALCQGVIPPGGRESGTRRRVRKGWGGGGFRNYGEVMKGRRVVAGDLRGGGGVRGGGDTYRTESALCE